MNGLELIQHIREKYIIKNDDCQLKVILISAFVISEFTLNEKVPNLKIDKIIEKPIPLGLFINEIEKLLGYPF
jgi:hypothetical protein